MKRPLYRSKIYDVWVAMRARCSNPRDRGYPRYGGRGITVCPEWDSFDRFLADMGLPPAGHSLDRIDNDAGYSPSNCRWADSATQRRNASKTSNITYLGRTQCLKDWAAELGLSYTMLRRRHQTGERSPETLFDPVKRKTGPKPTRNT